MHKSRNLTSHTYDEETAEEIAFEIRNAYLKLFQQLRVRLENERKGKQGKLFEN